MIDVESTIESQYANSPTILSLISGMNQYIDTAADIDSFFNVVWNVDTAVGKGLDIWGEIVGVTRYIKLANIVKYFGFSQAGAGVNAFQFGKGIFFNGNSAGEYTYSIDDEFYRKLILAKAISNISASTAPAINKIISNLFAGRGTVYVNDLGNMSMLYRFDFDLTDVEKAVLLQSGVSPRPAGVQSFMLTLKNPVFGFSECDGKFYQFGKGIFLPPGAIHAIQ